jgi:nucleotide-binding universal stress UspA family protein
VYQSIVVGTDGSETAAAAVRHAFGLARVTGATVHVVTAWSRVPALVLSSGAMGATQVPGDDGEWVLQLHERIREQAQEHGVPVTTHAVEEAPAKALVEVARDLDADLLVVGNQGMTGLRGKLGSVPNTVAHKGPCAVLVVPTSRQD